MPDWIRTILWILLIPATLIILYLILVILLGMITFYSPPEVEPIAKPEPCSGSLQAGDTLSLVTWNLGYAGLGKEMDFFYEGGHRVRPAKDLYEKYIQGILAMIGRIDSADFFLFQEVDLRAKRSYNDNQVERIRQQLPGYHFLFTLNYNVRFVPIPFARPMGHVRSGLLLAGRICPEEARRYAFPPDASWPTRLFMLQRCFMLTRIPTHEGFLTLIDTHHSAYDETGESKSVQLGILRTAMMGAYERGDFVIAGGDWNQNPPGFLREQIGSGDTVKAIMPPIPGNLMPEGWKWIYDPALPTNRDVNEPYVKGITPATIIDYFLVSPNVEVLEIKTIPTDFAFTDHQPVYMKVRLVR
jgi:endonuclease/exonuclease/phosphatase family metal-dependent hydrolase